MLVDYSSTAVLVNARPVQSDVTVTHGSLAEGRLLQGAGWPMPLMPHMSLLTRACRVQGGQHYPAAIVSCHVWYLKAGEGNTQQGWRSELSP